VLVLLPPSETKRDGGDGPPLALGALSFPELNPLRKQLVDDLVALAADVPASRATLGLSPRQDIEVARNAALWHAPTLPALHRYTGVLFEALDPGSLRGAAATRAGQRLVVCSALFGLVTASDPIPPYRLSAASTLPVPPTAGSAAAVGSSAAVGSGQVGRPGEAALATRWRPCLEPILATWPGLIVDLRSSAYAALGRAPNAIIVRILAEHPDGRRTVISHHNKSHKGRVARLLATTRAEPTDATDVLRLLRRASLRAEHRSATTIDIGIPM